VPVTDRRLTIFADVPDAFAPRAAWALGTMLAPLGRRVVLVRDPAEATGAVLAYAPAPVAGVPTIPCSAEAMELFGADRALPAHSFARRDGAGGPVIGAFPAPEAGFAFPFDLVASGFALLSCWDEHTVEERDRFDRLPYSASVFAANPELRIEEPAVDAYVALLRATVAPRLAALGREPLPATGWMWGDGEAGSRFAVALTHDLDNLWRWTPAGLKGAARAAARALRRGDIGAAGREARGVVEWVTHYLPHGTDPYWTFLRMLEGEDARRVPSTFYVIARHTARVDGGQPDTYARRIPAVLDLLRRAQREVGIHGNDADRTGSDALRADRDDLAGRAGSQVSGIRYHYLRCLYHETLPLLEAAGIEYDTSLAFAEHEGFRCGAGFPFSPYSLAAERPLRLLEVPLALMDTSLQGERYRALAAEEAEVVAREVLSQVWTGGGGVALLWHNVRFDPRAAAGYDDVYWRLVDWTLAAGGRVTTAEDLARRWRERTGAVAA
jgi:hypothetical protein